MPIKRTVPHDEANKYLREIKPGVFVDIYDTLEAFNVKSHALAHAAKKILNPGIRGSKGYEQDLNEAIDSIKRELEIYRENGLKND